MRAPNCWMAAWCFWAATIVDAALVLPDLSRACLRCGGGCLSIWRVPGLSGDVESYLCDQSLGCEMLLLELAIGKNARCCLVLQGCRGDQKKRQAAQLAGCKTLAGHFTP